MAGVSVTPADRPRRRRDELVADGGSRRLVAGADAGRGDEPHIFAGPGLKRLEKLLAAGHHA